MAQYQITQIRKPDVNSRVEHITHVFVPSYDPLYPIKVATVIAMIQHGLTETEASIANKLSRGTFAATFFLAALVALEVEGIRLEDI